MIFNKKVILVRHGNEKDNESSNPGLSKYGYSQAEKLAKIVERKIFGSHNIKLLSSPLLRAVETAEIISSKINNLPIQTEERLRDGIPDVAWLIDKLLHIDADVVIVISHFSLVRELPETLGFPNYFPGYCEGVYINEDIVAITII